MGKDYQCAKLLIGILFLTGMVFFWRSSAQSTDRLIQETVDSFITAIEQKDRERMQAFAAGGFWCALQYLEHENEEIDYTILDHEIKIFKTERHDLYRTYVELVTEVRTSGNYAGMAIISYEFVMKRVGNRMKICSFTLNSSEWSD